VGTLTIDGGELLLAAEDERLLTARLVPFHEECQSNLGRFTVAPGTLELPADATVAIMNDGHRRELPLASGVVYAERADGIYGSWRLAQSPEADAALADIKAKRRGAVSVEAEVVVEGGRATSGRIFGAALVSAGKRGAFPSAVLLATAADTAAVDPTDPTQAHYQTLVVDPDTGDQYETETTVEETEETDPDTGATIITTTTTDVKTITPGANAPAEGSAPVAAQPVPATDPLLAERTPGRVPAALLGKRPAARKPEQASTVNRRQLSLLLAKAAPSHRGGAWDGKLLEQLRSERVVGTLYAELDDITFDAAGSPNDMIVPQWIGELWSGRSYQRRWIPLFNSAGLTSPTVKGWRWKTRPEVAKWAGNKTDVPTGPVETEPYDTEAQPFAMAHDVDRRYRDFPNPEFWDGYFAAGTESYAKQSDLYVPEQLFDPANAALTAVTGGAVPADVNPVLARIVDGALAVLDEDLPSFAVVSKADWRTLMLTREQDNLAFLNASLGLEEGSIESFRVIPDGNAGLAGGKVLVGCRSAATVHELPGSPIRIEGLDVARGGIDPGLFGYTAVAIHNPAALALVSA
jgi:hypothetical protein